MKCGKCKAVILPGPTVIPQWMDSRLVMGNSQFTIRSVTIPFGTSQLLCTANPQRWAVGFYRPFGGTGSEMIAPAPNPGTVGWQPIQTVPMVWYDVFTYGPIVPAAWYASGLGAGLVGVIEVTQYP